MTRIRYKKTDNGMLQSQRQIQVGAELALVTLVPNTLQFTVTSTEGRVMASGTARNLAALKKVVKTELVAQGVVFDDEIRQRGTTENPDLELEFVSEEAS